MNGLEDSHALNHQNLSHYSCHGSGPNMILPGESSLGFSKEIVAELARVPDLRCPQPGCGWFGGGGGAGHRTTGPGWAPRADLSLCPTL